ncbi:MAG: 5-oxoprolinase subunit PxpB [Sphingobacteriales bacterium]|uniref:5-oxoprolinase subunit PxpB n=1 Tax=Hydrotalea flava TaxID=714549 RepID=UPI0008295D68|nr:5-oxoprolinase subunit PxpB [Hydrotalea flava]RTL52399.1 MAG: 5-oxoprolinase subunit PxpB [Sphingobacteriales bacterium]
MHPPSAYRIFPLSDTAISIDWGNTIDVNINNKVQALFQCFQHEKKDFIRDVIPAYSNITIIYNPVILWKQGVENIDDYVRKYVEAILVNCTNRPVAEQPIIQIPVCYHAEVAPDLQAFCAAKNITEEKLIQLHSSEIYQVFMLGFLPGFAYMGTVPESLAMPRKAQPATQVAAGSVGIAGRQTGIYPFQSPGGWHIIGQTPEAMFQQNRKQPALLQPGNRVQFVPIDLSTYYSLKQNKNTCL